MTPIRLPSVTGLMSAAVQMATVRLAEGARRNARGELEARAALARDGDEVARVLRTPRILGDHGPQGDSG